MEAASCTLKLNKRKIFTVGTNKIYLIQAIFVLVGLLSVLAALFNWEWFFTAHNTQFIVSNAGRQRARLFYAILGLLMIATGIYFFLNIQGIV